MSRRLILSLTAAAFVAPSLAHAQEGGAIRATETVAQGGGGRGRIVASVVETKITTGRPYSAEAVTEMSQTLGDGNRIQNRSATRVYRDGEGRTRREILDDDGNVRTIAISDPVAHANYTLDPKTKVAFKAGGNIVSPLRTPGSVGTYTFSTDSGVQGTSSATIVERQRTAAARGGGGGRGGSVPLMRTPTPDDPNVQKEDLGVQNIEGVSAAGTRTTTLIPAGKIGNAQEIRIVSERWFSDDLQVLVMTRHSDPRNGETVYRLRNILRAEPDPILFTVPTDYTVQQRGTVRRRQ